MTDSHKTPVLNNSTSINELIILADRNWVTSLSPPSWLHTQKMEPHIQKAREIQSHLTEYAHHHLIVKWEKHLPLLLNGHTRNASGSLFLC